MLFMLLHGRPQKFAPVVCVVALCVSRLHTPRCHCCSPSLPIANHRWRVAGPGWLLCCAATLLANALHSTTDTTYIHRHGTPLASFVIMSLFNFDFPASQSLSVPTIFPPTALIFPQPILPFISSGPRIRIGYLPEPHYPDSLPPLEAATLPTQPLTPPPDSHTPPPSSSQQSQHGSLPALEPDSQPDSQPEPSQSLPSLPREQEQHPWQSPAASPSSIYISLYESEPDAAAVPDRAAQRAANEPEEDEEKQPETAVPDAVSLQNSVTRLYDIVQSLRLYFDQTLERVTRVVNPSVISAEQSPASGQPVASELPSAVGHSSPPSNSAVRHPRSPRATRTTHLHRAGRYAYRESDCDEEDEDADDESDMPSHSGPSRYTVGKEWYEQKDGLYKAVCQLSQVYYKNMVVKDGVSRLAAFGACRGKWKSISNDIWAQYHVYIDKNDIKHSAVPSRHTHTQCTAVAGEWLATGQPLDLTAANSFSCWVCCMDVERDQREGGPHCRW